MKKYSILLSVVLFVSLFLSGCKKDDDKPAYVGTWEMTETSDNGQMKTTLTVTESTVTVINSYFFGEAWIDGSGMKATLSVSGDDVTLTLTEIGQAPYTMNGIGDIVWYTPSDEEFAALALDFGANANLQIVGKLTVDGDQLTIKTDNNGDGDYSDPYETQVFTRV